MSNHEVEVEVEFLIGEEEDTNFYFFTVSAKNADEIRDRVVRSIRKEMKNEFLDDIKDIEIVRYRITDVTTISGGSIFKNQLLLYSNDSSEDDEYDTLFDDEIFDLYEWEEWPWAR